MKKIYVLLVITIVVVPLQVLFAQWTEVSGGFPSDNVLSLAIKSSNGYIFAGTEYNGVYKSNSSGSGWGPSCSPGLYPDVYEVFSLAIDGSGYIYAGVHGSGLYRSTNDGGSWGNPSDLAGSFLPDGDIYAVAFGPTGKIYVSWDGSIYKSTDNGKNWYESKHSNGGTGGFQTIACRDSNVYVGGSYDWFYYSTNNGSSWNWEGSSSGLTKAPLSLAVNSSGDIFTGTSGGGVFKSTNYGVNWAAVNTGLTDRYINTIAINSSGVIYVGTHSSGVFTSIDNGAHWISDTTGLTNLDIRSIAFDPSGYVYAGAYKSSSNGGLWRSTALTPVELTTFTVSEKDNGAVLQWNTATEVNNYGFEIERRVVNGERQTVNSWVNIGFIKGAGTSNAPKVYSYSDAIGFSGRYIYRLKQVDNDGSYKYSNEAEVTIAVPKVFALSQNYPNPFNPSTTIEFTLAEDSHVSLKVFDMMGREVATLINQDLRAGEPHGAIFNASRLASGMYFYRLETEKSSLVKKLMLLK
jgi:photosystem II stability/assembly factor-like uncharacterized protein